MTDKNKTEIVAILDRSGSMHAIRDDMEGGFKRFIEEQKALPGECAVSVYQFDDQYDIVCEGTPIAQLPDIKLVPRGSTALLDAVGRSIVRVGERLERMPEAQRPGAVVVVIITDGHENASREMKLDVVREKIKHQESVYGWRFLYLGADASTFADAHAMGDVAAVMYAQNTVGAQGTYAVASQAIGNLRAATSRGAGQSVGAWDANVASSSKGVAGVEADDALGKDQTP